ncbi:DUF4199 domain-containing protein [Williamwhitmania taraxaci]|uniref:DUF4199 domain-containing protein n=1 Tax=Williamwhitmania taraxaci TaxID=1640674 RepID=A0A1G6GHV6_9BACT|nr:DUF4199 domain-containing protein [Williamwhitmania taraxaci]SDB81588.1 Protein of unknown function [Williamwhitmania taraxaci]
MENTETKGSILQPAMTYGLILSLGIILFSVVTYAMNNFNPSIPVQALQWAIMIGLVYFGQYKYRNDSKGGFLTYGQSLGFGTLIGFFASIVYSLFFIVMVKVVDTEYIQKMLQAMEQAMYEKDLPEDQIKMMMDMYSQKMTIGMLIVGSIFSLTFITFVLSLITSIFVKKSETPFGKDEFNG